MARPTVLATVVIESVDKRAIFAWTAEQRADGSTFVRLLGESAREARRAVTAGFAFPVSVTIHPGKAPRSRKARP